MKVIPSFEVVRSHERFRLTARASEAWAGDPHVQLLIKDTESGSAIRLTRTELMPLLGIIKEALKEVEDAVAGLPSDPVERAARRFPSQGMAGSMHRGHVLKGYAQELAELRERYVRRFDDMTAQANLRRPPKVSPPEG